MTLDYGPCRWQGITELDQPEDRQVDNIDTYGRNVKDGTAAASPRH